MENAGNMRIEIDYLREIERNEKERVLLEIVNFGRNVQRSPLIMILAETREEEICLRYLYSAIFIKVYISLKDWADIPDELFWQIESQR
jgi:hypothetical protein